MTQTRYHIMIPLNELVLSLDELAMMKRDLTDSCCFKLVFGAEPGAKVRNFKGFTRFYTDDEWVYYHVTNEARHQLLIDIDAEL